MRLRPGLLFLQTPDPRGSRSAPPGISGSRRRLNRRISLVRGIDRFVPQNLRKSVSRYRRARLVVGFSALALFWCVVFSLVFQFVLGLTVGAGLSLFGALILLAIPYLLRVTTPTVAGHFLVLVLYCVLGTLSWYLGGFSAPLMIWYAILPAVAGMVINPLAGMIWAVVVVLQLTAMFALEMFGLSPAARLGNSDVDLMACVSLIGFTALLVSLTQLYEDFERQTVRRLRRANRDLMHTRDEAVEANRSKASFLANMSHEFRTPLQAIIGYSDVLLEDTDDETETRDLQRIRTAGLHLLKLVNDLLDLTRLESGDLELERTTFPVATLLDDMAGLMQPEAARKSNRLVVECGPEVGRLSTDVTRLRQCLLNLLGNACKFTESGEVRLSAERQGKWVIIAVTDTGIGMTEEQSQKVFAPFVQADASTSRRFGGTGLGLAISDRLIRQLGGKISVESHPGVGSTFRLRLTDLPENPAGVALENKTPPPG